MREVKKRNPRAREIAREEPTSKQENAQEFEPEEPGEKSIGTSPRLLRREEPPSFYEEPLSGKHGWKRRFSFILLILAVLGGSTLWVISAYFSRATVTVHLQKSPWTYEGDFVADAGVARADVSQNTLPGELLSQTKNVTQLFPASGYDDSAQKAQGEITIYNAFNTSPQILVATTRFVTPDGKVFRLKDRVTVPGAAKQGGELVPASVTAIVIADVAGPSYNLTPVELLTIPGFQGTPRYEGFYGSLKKGTAGGGVGRKIPTEQDIAAAQTRVTQILKESLTGASLNERPAGLTMLEAAEEVKITKLTVARSTDAQGNFSVFGEATLRALVFRENDVKSFLEHQATRGAGDKTLGNIALTYVDVKPDFTHKKLTFSLRVEGIIKPAFSEDDFKGQILGKNAEEIRGLITNLPGLTDVKVLLWPRWAFHVPSNPNRVVVVVE